MPAVQVPHLLCVDLLACAQEEQPHEISAQPVLRLYSGARIGQNSGNTIDGSGCWNFLACQVEDDHVRFGASQSGSETPNQGIAAYGTSLRNTTQRENTKR